MSKHSYLDLDKRNLFQDDRKQALAKELSLINDHSDYAKKCSLDLEKTSLESLKESTFFFSRIAHTSYIGSLKKKRYYKTEPYKQKLDQTSNEKVIPVSTTWNKKSFFSFFHTK